MNKHSRNLINIITTGLVVIVLFSIVLFLCRWFCYMSLWENMPLGCRIVVISPSGLVPGEGMPQQGKFQNKTKPEPFETNETNYRFSRVYAEMQTGDIVNLNLGIFRHILAQKALYKDSNKRVYYRYKDKNNWLCFDENIGLFVDRREHKTKSSKGELETKTIDYFAGPKGISEKADSSLGRFFEPIAGWTEWGNSRICLYDKKMRKFYIVDYIEGKVKEGLQLAEKDSRKPIAIGRIEKGVDSSMNIWWSQPEVKDANENWVGQKMYLPEDAEPNREWDYWGGWKYISMLDENGRIYQLDTVNWVLKDAGYLPRPISLFSTEQQTGSALPREATAYSVRPVYISRELLGGGQELHREVKYLGMSVGVESREGASLSVAVFDPNGKLLYRGDTKMSKNEYTGGTIYAESPGSSFWTAVEFLLENLQPPVLGLASYLCADCFEASAGHRAIFILPNSFMGMLGRTSEGTFLERQVIFIFQIGLSLVLAVWLALRVRKDATLIGLGGNEKKWWIIGTIAFGLPAYITYRLTRPKETLVSCQNCGKMRRPDMDSCHHCGSKWEIPELTPPDWRICD